MKQVFRRDLIQNAHISWMHRGGSGVGFIHSCRRQIINFDIVVIATGSNDLANGRRPRELAEEFLAACQELRKVNHFVIVCSQWPRANTLYNTNVYAFNCHLESMLSRHQSIAFRWWDRRVKFATYDGVHLHSYDRAARHLASMVLFGLRAIGA